LAGANHSKDLYEVIQLHTILNGDEFEMKPGFKSFQNIKKGEEIARSNNDVLTSEYDAKIFMPLYQAKGQEGFFVIKKIKPLFVRLSSLLRSLRFDGLLIILPGITWQNRQLGVLRVNLATAKYLAKPIFHLLGYRNRQADDTHILLYNRERVAKTKMYKKEFWYKKNV
jgi:succinylglutamate desuccinylase